MSRRSVFTIGHSTRPIEDFIHLLKSHGVKRVIDVRTMPRSRFNPQYDVSRLPALLRAAHIEYTHLPGLGGLRKTHADSPNTGWRNTSFRGYADYMQSESFKESLQQCLGLASAEPVVLMCAEAVPWRCHRSLIADALVVRGIDALEIASETRVRPHVLTPFARVAGTEITYPAGPAAPTTEELDARRHKQARSTAQEQPPDGGRRRASVSASAKGGSRRDRR